MKRILLVVTLVASCDSGKPKEQPGSAPVPAVAEAKPTPPPVVAAVPPAADPPAGACDAEALKEQGMTHINKGEHAAALVSFEASLTCKDDPYVTQLAFMESCASSNSPKAKFYYRSLSPEQQTRFAQICIRQAPPVPYE